MPEQLTEQERQEIVRTLRRLARTMDEFIPVPGTKFKFGLDPLLGLAIGVGDVISMAISAYIIIQAHRLGVPRATLLRMIGNVGFDGVVGTIPVLGQLFDFGFKANRRNLRLLDLLPEFAKIQEQVAAAMEDKDKPRETVRSGR